MTITTFMCSADTILRKTPSRTTYTKKSYATILSRRNGSRSTTMTTTTVLTSSPRVQCWCSASRLLCSAELHIHLEWDALTKLRWLTSAQTTIEYRSWRHETTKTIILRVSMECRFAWKTIICTRWAELRASITQPIFIGKRWWAICPNYLRC